MGHSPRQRVQLTALAAAALVGSVLSLPAHAWDSSPLNKPVVRHVYQCGAHDRRETGLQGQVPKADQTSGRAKKGYNCGLELIGFTPLDKTADGKDSRPNANANMAWAGRCAYVSGSADTYFTQRGVSQGAQAATTGAGVAVVDVHDPQHPAMVRILRAPGATQTSETLHAITRPDGTGVLVVGQYGLDYENSAPKPMDIYTYDTRDRNCGHLRHIDNPADPKKLATFMWPRNIHNLTITPDGNYVYATMPTQAIDLRQMWKHPGARAATHIKYVGLLDNAVKANAASVGPSSDLLPSSARVAPRAVNFLDSHEAWATDDTTLYTGGQTPLGENLSVVDVRAWLASDGAKPATLISEYAGRGHSIRSATINGHRYLLHSEESVFGAGFGCLPQLANPGAGAAEPFLTNIDDPKKPKTVAQMGLEINEPQNCAAQVADGENDSVHYHDVDSTMNTHFVMASMWNAGIRIFDVRDPIKPTEVAYFNPADVAGPGQGTQLDQAWGHIRYDQSRGEIWFATASGGFFVVRIEDQVRRQLKLPAVTSTAPLSHRVRGIDAGWPGTAGVHYSGYTLADILKDSQYYCTVAPSTQVAAAHHRSP